MKVEKKQSKATSSDIVVAFIVFTLCILYSILVGPEEILAWFTSLFK